MDEKYKDKYRTVPARLTGWDYGSHGLYFITICTKDRIHHFGTIGKNPVETDNYLSLNSTQIGQIAHDYWLQIPDHFPFVELDDFVIMPDHIHGIILLISPMKWDGSLTNLVHKVKIWPQLFGVINLR